MTDKLTEALALAEVEPTMLGTEYVRVLAEAARRWASFPTDADVERAADQWRIELPCICGPEYSERGLVSPHCDHHAAEDAARAMLEAVKREDHILFALHQSDVAKMSDDEFQQVWDALGVVARARQREGSHSDLTPVLEVGPSLHEWAKGHMPGSSLSRREDR